MIVVCEECGKRYRIDSRKITKDLVRTRCKECGNIIEITARPNRAERTESQTDALPRIAPQHVIKVSGSEAGSPTRRSRFSGIGFRLILLFLVFMVLLGGLTTVVYLKYVPSLMSEQIRLRANTLSRSFSAAVIQPLLLRNYLQVNQIAEYNVQQPGVAYIAVLNKRGIATAGVFGDMERFTPQFVHDIRSKGFPVKLIQRNPLPKGARQSNLDLTAGGQRIHDVAVPLGESGGVAHVGLFTADVQEAVRQALTPLWMILGVMAVLGTVVFFILARTIAGPIRQLTDAAKRIGLGHIDESIEVRGSGEIAELAGALEMMRLSVKSAIYRLRKR